MLTIEKVKADFSFIEAFSGDSELYHNSVIFEGHGDFCDLYFRSREKSIKQDQLDKYNEFKIGFKNYLPEIEKYILNSLNNSEINLNDSISSTTLVLEILEIPYDSFKYDMVLICSKSYKKFFFIKRSINIRVEIKNEKIKSIQRKTDTSIDNEN